MGSRSKRTSERLTPTALQSGELAFIRSRVCQDACGCPFVPMNSCPLHVQIQSGFAWRNGRKSLTEGLLHPVCSYPVTQIIHLVAQASANSPEKNPLLRAQLDHETFLTAQNLGKMLFSYQMTLDLQTFREVKTA